jgi:hypothetical protein
MGITRPNVYQFDPDFECRVPRRSVLDTYNERTGSNGLDFVKYGPVVANYGFCWYTFLKKYILFMFYGILF